MQSLSYAYPRINCRAVWRTCLDDFQVFEELAFAPDGEGEHVLLQIEKRDSNTQWVAQQLARFADVKPMDVSYAGLKDRFAITTQWFSVRLAGKANPDWTRFTTDEFKVLQWHLHKRKLKRGSLTGNRFVITLHAVDGDRKQLEQRLQMIAVRGVPNYFTEQRFGRDGHNLSQADKMFKGEIRVRDRHKRGLYLSAARSFLFNLVLSRRVEQSSWDRIVPGEIVLLDGSRSYFVAEDSDDALPQRLEAWDVHPTGPLPGRQRPFVSVQIEKEQQQLTAYQAWLDGLVKAGLDADRRPLRVRVEDLQWQFQDDDRLQLGFYLQKGSYATAVLRELVNDLNAMTNACRSGL